MIGGAGSGNGGVREGEGGAAAPAGASHRPRPLRVRVVVGAAVEGLREGAVGCTEAGTTRVTAATQLLTSTLLVVAELAAQLIRPPVGEGGGKVEGGERGEGT